MSFLTDTEAVWVVIISVAAHVTAAIWYTRRQRIHFEKRTDEKLSDATAAIRAEVAAARSVTTDSIATIDRKLEPFTQGKLAVEIPDFEERVRHAIEQYSKGAASKIRADAEKIERESVEEAMVESSEHPEVLEALDFLGLSAEERRKAFRLYRAVEKYRSRRSGGGVGDLTPYG